MDNNQLRAFRKSTGLNQADFANSIGYARISIANWETGVTLITPEAIKAINKKYPDAKVHQIENKEQQSILDSYILAVKRRKNLIAELDLNLKLIKTLKELLNNN